MILPPAFVDADVDCVVVVAAFGIVDGVVTVVKWVIGPFGAFACVVDPVVTVVDCAIGACVVVDGVAVMKQPAAGVVVKQPITAVLVVVEDVPVGFAVEEYVVPTVDSGGCVICLFTRLDEMLDLSVPRKS